MNKSITLNYDPKYQRLIKLSGYIFYFQFLIFIAQLILLFHNRTLLGFATSGDWGNFLKLMNDNSKEFLLIKILFLTLRTCYVVSILGYIMAMRRVNKGVTTIFAGFMFVSLAVIQLAQVFQIALIPLAKEYVKTALTSGSAVLIQSYQINAHMIYIMTEYADAFVNYVLFFGAFVCWFILALKKPHPRYLPWIILLLAVLPFNRLINMPILGLLNAFMTGVFFVLIGKFMLSLHPQEQENRFE